MTGAAGLTGHGVVGRRSIDALVEAGLCVRAVTRDPARAAFPAR